MKYISLSSLFNSINNSSNILNTSSSGSSSTYPLFRNVIINPEMLIDQRNEDQNVSITTDNIYYGPDRYFLNVYTGTTNYQYNMQKMTTANIDDIKTSLKITANSNITFPSSSNYISLCHGIEGNYLKDWLWGKSYGYNANFSFYIRTNVMGIHNVSFRNNTLSMSYIYPFTISTSNWTKINLTIPKPTTGYWSTDSNIGILIDFDNTRNSTSNSTTSSWLNGNYTCPANYNSNIWTTANNYIEITGLQLEKGGSTPFESRPYTFELGLCQRYYEKSFNNLVQPQNNTLDGCDLYLEGQYGCGFIYFKQQKNQNPTINFYNPCSNIGNAYVSSTNYSSSIINAQNANINGFSITSSDTNLQNNMVSFNWVANSEYNLPSTEYKSGGYVQWIAKCQSSSTGNDLFNGICSLSDNSIVAAGYYTSTGTLTAYNANLTTFGTILPNSSSGVDPFLVKYNSSGIVQWISKCQGTGSDQFNGICSLSDDSVVAVGYYDSTGTLTAYHATLTTFGTILPASATAADSFLVKYNSSGIVQWIAKCQSSSTGSDLFNGICSTSDNGIVAAGYYDSAASLTAYHANLTTFGTILPASSTSYDPFLVKYNSSGTVQWIAKCQSSSTGSDQFKGICSLSDNSIIAAGYYDSSGTLTAYHANLTNFGTILPDSITNSDPFLIKYNSSGIVQWIAKCQSNNANVDQFNGICSLSDNSIIAVGYYNSVGTLTAYHADLTIFGTILPVSNTSQDVFLVKYNSSGTVQWIARCQSSSTLDQFSGICSLSDNSIVAAGYYNSGNTLIAYNSDGTTFGTRLLPINVSQDPFLVKYGSSGNVLWITRCQSSSTGNYQFFGICSTSDNGIVAVGVYNSTGTLTAYHSNLTTFNTILPASNTGQDSFLVKYSV